MMSASSWFTFSTNNNNYYFSNSFYVSGSVLSTYIHIRKWFKCATKFETLAVAPFYTYMHESTKGFQGIVKGESLAFSSTSPKWMRISGQAAQASVYFKAYQRLPSECLRIAVLTWWGFSICLSLHFTLSFSPGLQWIMNLWVSHSHSLSIIGHSWVKKGQLCAEFKCFNI